MYSNQRSSAVTHAVGAGAALLVLLTLIVVRISDAAFTATTSNTANSWSAGTVSLSDDDSGTAMFSVTGLVPGTVTTRCITVTYSGSMAADVKLYGAMTAGTGLETYLDLTVERGAGGTFASCAGFVAAETAYTGTLAGFAATTTNFATGAGSWSPAGAPPSTSVTYRFTTTLQDNNLAQGLSATASFTWEAQNT